MKTNQNFAVSVHILTVLAAHPNLAVTSDAIAESVNTNPVVIRRIMAHLRQHHLVESRPGVSGGWRLQRPAEHISLCEVYRATTHEDALSMHQHPNPHCAVGGKIRGALTPMFDEAQDAMEAALENFTIADVLESVFARATA